MFTNAEILVPEPEWTYWMDDAEMNRAPDRIKVYFRNARRIFGDIGKEVRRFKPGAEVGARHHVDSGVRPHAGALCVRHRLSATNRCWR